MQVARNATNSSSMRCRAFAMGGESPVPTISDRARVFMRGRGTGAAGGVFSSFSSPAATNFYRRINWKLIHISGP